MTSVRQWRRLVLLLSAVAVISIAAESSCPALTSSQVGSDVMVSPPACNSSVSARVPQGIQCEFSCPAGQSLMLSEPQPMSCGKGGLWSSPNLTVTCQGGAASSASVTPAFSPPPTTAAVLLTTSMSPTKQTELPRISSTQSLAAASTLSPTSVNATQVISGTVAVKSASMWPSTSSVAPTTHPRAAAPRNVTALSRTSQSFLVSWLEPTLNGELVRYEVSVRKKADILATISPTTQTVAKSTPSSAPATEAPSESPDEELINAGSKLSIIIGSREKWTEYMVQVRAVTKPEQPGRYSDAVTVRTVEDVPEAPRDVKATVLNSTAVFLNWTEPLVKNGILVEYKVSYSINGSAAKLNISTRLGTSLVLSGLKPNSRYVISVRAFTRVGGGPGQEVVAQTEEGVPSAPRAVTATPLNSTAVRVNWTTPEYPNGRVGYRVSYEPGPSEALKTTDTKIVIAGLEEFVQYNFTVVAVNVKHEELVSGPAPVATARTREAAPTGEPQDVSAVTESNSTIRVAWAPPPEAERNGLITNYVVKYYASASPNAARFSNTTDGSTTLLIGGLQSFQVYDFTVRAVNKAGIGPESETVSNKTFEAAPSPPLNLSVEPINATSIRVTWKPPANPNGVVKFRLYTRPSSKSPGADRLDYDGEDLARAVSGLEEFTLYIVTLVAYNVKHGWNSSAVETRFRTHPGKPTGPPLNVTAEANSSQSIIVTWDPPRPADRNGLITHYLVTYQPPNGAGNQSKTDDNTTWLVVGSLGKYHEYTFTVKAVNSEGNGPASEPVTKRTLEDVPGHPSHIEVSAASATVLQVMWRPPVATNGKITSFRLCWQREGYEEACEHPLASDRKSNISKLEPYSLYTIRLAAETSVGFGPNITTKRRTMEGAPPPVGTLAPPSSPEGKTFEVELLKVPDTYGEISFYQVVVKELPKDSRGDPVPDSKNPQNYKPHELFTYDQAQKKKPQLVPYVAAQFSAEKFDEHKTFTVGNGLKTRASAARRRRGVGNDTFYDNGPLEPSTYYTVFQRAYVKKDLYSSSAWIKPVQTGGGGTTSPPPTSGVDVGLVVGLSVFIVILVVVMLVSFWILRRKRSKFGGSPLDDSQSVDGAQPLKKLSRKRRSQQKRLMGSTDSLDTLNDLAAQRARRVPIPASEFERHVDRMHTDGDHGFSEEYALVEPDEEYQCQAFLNPANKFKNRYANIVAYDHSRVLLSQIEGVPGSDYINANYIDGYKREKAFIAAQGPLYETFDDFWRMVWETHAHVIVMLTRLEERGRRKCDQYWPDTGLQLYGRVEVTVSEILHMSHFTLRTFLVTHKQFPEEERIVKQYHYTTWPDHDVPSHPTPLLSLLRRASSANSDPADPMVVHCSAGVGRTGTFITLDVMQKRIANDEPIDVFGFVRQMRTQRNIMVQTEAQYVFIHDALVEALNCGMTEVEAKELRARIRELYVEDDTGCTNMEKEFGRLAKEENHPMAFKNASMSCNSTKNRYCNILPFDSSRVRLRMRPGDLGSDYINASAVDGYCQPKAYIATQAPLPSTYSDFWRMVWEQHSASIVMLTKEEEGGKVRCHHYWPSDGARQYGEILVELIEETTYSDYVTRKFKLTHTELKDTRTIRHFQYVDWPDNGMPDTGVGLVDLIGQVQKWQQQSGNNAIIVHCSGGVGRTGVFCAMSVMIERLKAEGLIDVFQTVQAMRLQRPAMVQTKEQYEFCYTALQEYLDSFDLYANFQ